MSFAPIVLFVYNRPSHTRQTLESLMANKLADQSELIIYADGPKKDADENTLSSIREVRKVIREKQWCKDVKIVESNENKGLAQSIIAGVTEVVNQYGKIIVLEDDIVTSEGFLKYMIQALNVYQNEEKVMHISGFIYPVNHILPETFFYNVNSCWGWGTWKRAWNHLSLNGEAFIDKLNQLSKQALFRFNGGQLNHFQKQLEYNISGKMNTWAIFWHCSIFFNGGFCLHPGKSLVRNIGLDSTGANSKKSGMLCELVLAENIKVEKQTVKEHPNIGKYMYRFFYLQYLKSKLKKYVQKVFR